MERSGSAKSRFRLTSDAAFIMPLESVASFQIQLNGEAYTVDGNPRLNAFIAKLKLRKGRVAIEINRAVIPKAEWDNTTLKPGDCVEIVNFVGGG